MELKRAHPRSASIDDRVQRGAGAHGREGLGVIGLVVAADIRRGTLRANKFCGDLALVRGELLGDGGEVGLQSRVVILRREGLGPIEREVEVAAPVVDLTKPPAG